MRLLTIDIETSPHLAHVWSLWKQNVPPSAIRQRGQVMCFAAKWYGEKDILFHSDFHDGHEQMIRRAHELLDEADGVIGYNSRAFDMKHLAREFLVAGLPPPSPYKDIDLWRTVHSTFKFASNKLDQVAGELGMGRKVRTDFGLWLGCIQSDEAAWAKMRRYNVQDVRLTERLYERLLPWIKQHPHLGLYVDELRGGCSKCGGRLQRRGFYHTNVGRYVKYQCLGCRSYMRAKHADRLMNVRPAT